MLTKLHDGPVGGHFVRETMSHKILHVGYYWLSLFKDAYAYSRKCKVYQIAARREKKLDFPLQPIEIEGSFEQWGLDIIGDMNPNSS